MTMVRFQNESVGANVRAYLDAAGVDYEMKLDGRTHARFKVRRCDGALLVIGASCHRGGSWHTWPKVRCRLRRFLAKGE